MAFSCKMSDHQKTVAGRKAISRLVVIKMLNLTKSGDQKVRAREKEFEVVVVVCVCLIDNHIHREREKEIGTE